ncbi:MAG: bifunctional folylpolyglutamate synthase/dihydrofolate synthase, partial [Candidatus Cryptobacteroides sp.]
MNSFSEQNYKNKIDSIYSRFPSVQKVPFSDAYKPGLDRMERFCAALGNPQDKFRTIHVAGTNGKGSVANMLSSALAAQGLKVGLYTSPHILDFRERMRIKDGEGPVELIPKEAAWSFLCANEQLMDSLDLSFFEITTGMAFRWFADQKVDVAVIEVGLGGRLDSTNVITPDLAVVTSIALDHCALLGNTLGAVASEKAGIFKRSVPALVGEYLPETRPVFEAAASGLCPLEFAQDSEPRLWDRRKRILQAMDLRGEYQQKNLRTVLAALDILSRMPFYASLGQSETIVPAICRTARRMDFHGRWECLSHHPAVIADIGHNPAALKENFTQLESLLAKGEYSSLIVIYAVMADKDLDAIMPLMPQGATYIFTNPSISRSLPEKELTSRYLDFCSRTGRNKARVHDAPDPRTALGMAFSLARAAERKDAPDPLIFVGGSTYLVSEVVAILK